MNSISGKRYKGLANSSAMTELRSAAIRAPGKSETNSQMPALPLHRTNFRASRSEKADTCKVGVIRGGFCGAGRQAQER